MEGEGSFNSIVQRYRVGSGRVVEGDVTEEDKDDENGIRFVTLESRFENKETVLNWQTINLPCLLCKKMAKALFAWQNI